METKYRGNFWLLKDVIYSHLKKWGLLKRTPTFLEHYKTKEGVKYKFRKNVWDSVTLFENWVLNEYSRYLKKKENIKIVVDVGAHIGSFAVFAATNWDSEVYAFEPEPQNFGLLKENIKLNNLERKIFPFKLAVSSKKRVKMTLDPDNFGAHSVIVYKARKILRKSFWAKTISLREIFVKNKITKCDFLKMDAEGCEYEIILSSPEEVLARVKNVALEYHPCGDILKVKHYLTRCGFKVRFDRILNIPIVGSFTQNRLLFAVKN